MSCTQSYSNIDVDDQIQTRFEELLRRKHFQPFPRNGAEHLKNDYVVAAEQISPLLAAGEERIRSLEDEV